MKKTSESELNLTIIEKFDAKLEDLKEKLPDLKGRGINCCELTLTNIIEILGFEGHYFNNSAIPLAGGFGGYKSKQGWQGPCGAVTGACMAIGIIMGGEERMDDNRIPMAYLKAQKYCSEFESEFGSVVCADICGYDFSTPEGMVLYQKNDIWRHKCYKFVLWAAEKVKDLMKRELKKKWAKDE